MRRNVDLWDAAPRRNVLHRGRHLQRVPHVIRCVRYLQIAYKLAIGCIQFEFLASEDFRGECLNKSSYVHEDRFRRCQVLVTGKDAVQKKQSNKANDTS